jgi:UDP-2,3-diacylglucosamine pyrophosphatase LpxH
MSREYFHENLTQILQTTPAIPIKDEDRYVILSDMHIGNGRDQDDFLRNGPMVYHVLQRYYLARKYSLVLNGDIEELFKFSVEQIYRSWNHLFKLFSDFESTTKLVKIVGNHDSKLPVLHDAFLQEKLVQGFRLIHDDGTLCIFHGHQLSKAFLKYNDLMGLLIKFFVYPLKIKNPTAAYHSKKRFRIEKRIYNFSAMNRSISIIGHTHRPLFESLSRSDYLRFKIEQLCREYPNSDEPLKRQMETQIEYYKTELYKDNLKRKNELHNNLYNADVIVPCVFNSGCVIGKRGMTAIELSEGKIRLVHWFDTSRNGKSYSDYENQPESLDNTQYSRMILKEDHLNYIFTRIRLLT